MKIETKHRVFTPIVMTLETYADYEMLILALRKVEEDPGWQAAPFRDSAKKVKSELYAALDN
jgi:hypothetical protein